MGFTSRCDKSISLGCPGTEGAQAEYIRIPLADSSLFHVERDSTIPQELMLIMTDILPTGYSAAYNARKLLGEEWGSKDLDKDGKKGVCVVMGCGPVCPSPHPILSTLPFVLVTIHSAWRSSLWAESGGLMRHSGRSLCYHISNHNVLKSVRYRPPTLPSRPGRTTRSDRSTSC